MFLKFILLIFLLVFVSGNKFFNDRYTRDFVNFSNDDNSHLEQCALVNFIMGKPGFVNVLAFLDNSWPFSYKQATMLKLLKDRLQRSGLPDALFFVITTGSLSNSIENSPEDDVEKEAWERVSPDEAMEISAGLSTEKSLGKIISSDIFVIEDNSELEIWKELKGTRDQILVIDRCGKLAYQVIVPWSILHFPYVKAAILSTHNDDPCGPCNYYSDVLEFDQNLENSKDKNIRNETEATTVLPELFKDIEYTTVSGEETELTEGKNDEMIFPGLRIIMHAPHIHDDDESMKKHEYLILNTGESNYHGHLEGSADNSDFKEARENLISDSIFDIDESPGLYGEVADFWRDFVNDDNRNENKETIDYSEVTENIQKDTIIMETDESSTLENISESVTNLPQFTIEEEESRSKLIAHYSRLLPWIYYVLDQ